MPRAASCWWPPSGFATASTRSRNPTLALEELEKEIMRNPGFVLVDLACYVVRRACDNEDRYAATWKRANEKHGRFEMFSAIPVHDLPGKIKEFQKKSSACSSLQGVVRSDGQVRFCGVFDNARADRPRRFFLSETERGYELNMFKLSVPDQGPRDDLEAVDVSVYQLPEPSNGDERKTEQLRDREVATLPEDEESSGRLLRAWTKFRLRQNQEVLNELHPMITRGNPPAEVYQLGAYAHARLGEEKQARDDVEKIPDVFAQVCGNKDLTKMIRRVVDAVIAAYLRKDDATRPIEELIRGESATM